MRIVLIEDDEEISEILAQGLRTLRHEVLVSNSGSSGIGLSMTRDPDFIVLDLGLPDLDGLDVLKMIRSASTVPILVATGRGAEAQMIRGLELGADDYVVKPYTAGILHARIGAIARRSHQFAAQDELQVGDLVVDLRGHTVHLDGRTLHLRPKEFQLLAYLVANSGRVIGKNELRAEVWESDFACTDKTLAVHLSWLRRHLGETAAHPRYLHTVRGVGVKVTAPQP